MQGENTIIEQLKKNDRKAQRKLYQHYSPVLLGICMRYAKDKPEAEDILQDSFVKIFEHITQYEGKGSFEGWLKRIVVNTAITHLQRMKKHNYHADVNDMHEILPDEAHNEPEYTREELLGVIRSLPEGYRIVFNMYAIEGYKHKEIAEILGVDENTSKSQYSRAKGLIRKKLMALSKQTA